MKPLLIIIIAAIAAATAAQAQTQRARPPVHSTPRSSPRSARPAPRLTPDAINNPSAPLPVASGPSAIRAQILLDQAGFSVGQIDGSLGRNTQGALDAFRQAHNFPASGKMDQTTWAALNSGSTPALIPYSITGDDLKGPFVPTIPTDMMEKAKLDYLGYASPLEELAERFHVNPQILKALNPRAAFDTAGAMLMVPAVHSPREAKAAKVVVSKSDSSVSAFDAQGQLLARYPASSGSDHDPLPIGTWKITYIFKNPKFFYNPDLFWDADSKQAKAVIKPGPNNPVGLVWINLSKQHYGIHGTPDPSQIGHTQSHGCIRLTNWDALELAGMVAPGTPAELVRMKYHLLLVLAAIALAADQHPAFDRVLSLPVPGATAADIRDTFNEARGTERRHEATDIVAPRGSPVLAVEDGVIKKLFLSKPGGLTIYQFDPTERFCYYYAHLSGYAVNLKEGMQVKRGQLIGYVGTTGNAPPQSPHLHFGITVLGPEKKWYGGTPLDPYPFLRAALDRR